MMIKLEKSVYELVEQELKEANKNNPPFCSPHEGAAVIREEYEEAEYELQTAKLYFESMWRDIKHDSDAAYVRAGELKKSAVRAACEAIQTAAMASKMQKYYEEKAKKK